MPGCNIYVWLFLFAAFAIDLLAVTVQTGLYNRVELTGEKLDQQTVDSLKEVEWTNLNKSCLCLRFCKQNSSEIVYRKCCGKAHFYLNNNSLILENVTAQVEGVFKETIVTNNSATKSFIFVLNILYPLNATGIVVSWSYNNTSVSLTCKVSGTYTDIMWMREDSPIQRDNRHSFSNQTLHISNITNLDYGQYSCVATNSYEKSETQIYIISEECSTNGENTTFYQEHDANSNRHQAIQIFLWSGLALGILGLCISVFYGINKYRHSQVHRQDTKQDGNTRGHRREDDRTTEEDVDIDLGIYQTSLSHERPIRTQQQQKTLRILDILRLDQQSEKKLFWIAAAQMNSPHRVLTLRRNNS
ncbi:intraflagellar transport protein 46 homolog isoform X2 [Triplophysa rosa]|uniref:intraflagellar transport protein 46 homolog isoform X2 n=1 Tax=Triplophysa rosa TaxID=992332 RepID=UPI002546347A|nr:intraflagellar transport protein 46 homolog isoform X2 [Triplophysa rosa]